MFQASLSSFSPSGEWATISQTRIKTGIHSIRWKFLFAYLLTIAVAFVAVGASLLQLVGDFLLTQRVKEDQHSTNEFAVQIMTNYRQKDAEALYAAAVSLCNDERSRVLILDRYGVVQVDSLSEINGSRFNNREAAQVLTETDTANGFYTVARGRSTWLDFLPMYTKEIESVGVYASALRVSNETIGAVVYISQNREIYEGMREIQFKIAIGLVLVAMVVMLISLLLVRGMLRPVDALKSGIARMSTGDFSARVKVRGRNEFSELAAAFNSMSERLEQLDESRNQFVSSASHELKTPLSTMKILIETILYQDPIDADMTKEFLSDVNKEIDRLNRIVSDLLTLVHIDSGLQLNSTVINLKGLLLEQMERLKPLARENGIELYCEKSENLSVMGDPLKLQQVIYNVIDNAIKYTLRGGEVSLTLEKVQKMAVISIADTGIGIPKEDLAHIFDRFYRVDKARSRATGGTGLGLSIVKQIVQLHGGTITASSEEEKGTTFRIELPLYEE